MAIPKKPPEPHGFVPPHGFIPLKKVPVFINSYAIDSLAVRQALGISMVEARARQGQVHEVTLAAQPIAGGKYNVVFSSGHAFTASEHPAGPLTQTVMQHNDPGSRVTLTIRGSLKKMMPK